MQLEKYAESVVGFTFAVGEEPGGPQARVSSPVSGRSTLMTSAPRSPVTSACTKGPAKHAGEGENAKVRGGPDMN